MDHQQNSRQDGSHRVPPLFTVNNAVLGHDEIRVVKHAGRSLEIQAFVFHLVHPVLPKVPFEAHIVIHSV